MSDTTATAPSKRRQNRKQPAAAGVGLADQVALAKPRGRPRKAVAAPEPDAPPFKAKRKQAPRRVTSSAPVAFARGSGRGSDKEFAEPTGGNMAQLLGTVDRIQEKMAMASTCLENITGPRVRDPLVLVETDFGGSMGKLWTVLHDLEAQVDHICDGLREIS